VHNNKPVSPGRALDSTHPVWKTSDNTGIAFRIANVLRFGWDTKEYARDILECARRKTSNGLRQLRCMHPNGKLMILRGGEGVKRGSTSAVSCISDFPAQWYRLHGLYELLMEPGRKFRKLDGSQGGDLEENMKFD
jgi:hypothetical protein